MQNVKRILFCCANPVETSRLRIDEEYREIEKSLMSSIYRNRVEVYSAWATTAQDLLDKVIRYEPDIVHFSGHGHDEGIVLEDHTGNCKIVSGEALGALFEIFKGKVTCVVLNSCFSCNQAMSINQFVPYVIGSCDSLPDSAAVAFSCGFYKAIGADKDIYDAFKLGLASIKLEGLPGSTVPTILHNTDLQHRSNNDSPELPEQSKNSKPNRSNKSLIIVDIDSCTRIGSVYGDKIVGIVKDTIYDIIADYSKKNGIKSMHDWLLPFSDELFIILWEDLPSSLRIAKELRSDVASFNWQGVCPNLYISISCGVVSYFPGEATKDLVIKGLLGAKQAKIDRVNSIAVGPQHLPKGSAAANVRTISEHISECVENYYVYMGKKYRERSNGKQAMDQMFARELLRIRDFLMLGRSL